MSKILGIDFGTKKVGIAMSDDDQKWAFPHKIVRNDESLIEEIKKIMKEKEISTIVLGRPRHIGGDVGGGQIKNIEMFAGSLRKNGHEVIFEDETATTDLANGDDSKAAAIILQGYLDGLMERKVD